MKTAALALDFYDDPKGEVLKKAFESPDKLPDIIKEAHILNAQERGVLRDDAFALVMVDEGKVFRKFACVDAGNTALSTLYFLANKDRLPEEAQKVAAANLLAYCEEFGLPTETLTKAAAAKGMGRKRDPMNQGPVSDDVEWSQRTNLSSVQGSKDTSRVMDTASKMKTAFFDGVEKITPEQWNALYEHPTSKALVKKHGRSDHPAVDAHIFGMAAKKYYKNKTAGMMVDVTGKMPKVAIEKRASKTHALGDRYPLDSFADVTRAVEYFEQNYLDMDPADRHEYCVKTAARAEELGIETSETMQRYGSESYAPDAEAHLASRRAIVGDHVIDLYTDLGEKRAEMEPTEYVELLTEIDKVASVQHLWGGPIADPYFSTFGGPSEKEKRASWSWQGSAGDYVTAEQLSKLARNGRPLLLKHFDEAIVKGFCADPVTIFSSLPETTKIIISRLAADEYDGLATN